MQPNPSFERIDKPLRVSRAAQLKRFDLKPHGNRSNVRWLRHQSRPALYYCALGLAALKHLPGATEQDRVVGWTLWWFLDASRYDEAGKRLCQRGGVVFAIAWALAVPGYYLALQR